MTSVADADTLRRVTESRLSSSRRASAHHWLSLGLPSGYVRPIVEVAEFFDRVESFVF